MKNANYFKRTIITIVVLFLTISYSLSSSVILITGAVDNSYITIEGKVIDSETKEPLIFVTVTAEGTNIGTVTNTEGMFTLNIEKGIQVEEIIFKHLGYKNKTVPLIRFTTEENIIKMDSYFVPLEEVVVRPENPYEILTEVLNKIPQNYSADANKHMAFYRETIKNKRKYVSISEAVVEIFKAPYNDNMAFDLVKLYKGRKSANVNPQDTIIMKLKGGPKTALLLDLAKNPEIIFAEDFMEQYKFNIDKIVNINDKQNYIIDFKQIENPEYPLFNGKLYVDIKTLAITAAEFSINLENEIEAAKIFVRKKPLMMKIVPISTSYIVKYEEDNGKYYFSHARGEVSFKVKWKQKLFNSRYTIMTEIATTDRTTDNVVKYARNEQLKSNIVFEEKVYPFSDPDFWGKYNTIKPEESIENAIKKYGVRLKIQND